MLSKPSSDVKAVNSVFSSLLNSFLFFKVMYLFLLFSYSDGLSAKILAFSNSEVAAKAILASSLLSFFLSPRIPNSDLLRADALSAIVPSVPIASDNANANLPFVSLLSGS